MVRRGVAWALTILGFAVTLAFALQPVRDVDSAKDGWLVPATSAVAVALGVASIASLSSRPGRSIRAMCLSVVLATTLHADPRSERFLLALTLVALFVPLAVSLVVRLSDPPVRRLDRRIVDALAGLAGMLGIARVLFYDPFLDIDCLGCPHRSPILGANPTLANSLGHAAIIGELVACAGAALAVLHSNGWSLARVTRSPGKVGAFFVVGFTATDVLARMTASDGHVAGMPSRLMLTSRLAACSICTAILGVSILHHALVRHRLRRVATWLETDENPAEVELRLRKALGDDDLRIAYPTESGGYVGLSGAPLDNIDADLVTALTVRNDSVAVIAHGNMTAPHDVVTQQLGHRARVAIQNESLRMQLERNVKDLREGRSRIVEAMATARQSLERDLHDGAQQRIVAALFELRRGERAALRAGEPALAQKLGSICALADRSLEQLRHVANGVHPHLLTSDGLETALVSLTDTTREPLSLSVRLDGALPPELDHNLYCIVSDVVGRSAHEGRGAVKDVEIMRADGMVVTRIRGTAVVVSGEVSDRVDAAGGWWAGGADEVRVELPCES